MDRDTSQGSSNKSRVVTRTGIQKTIEGPLAEALKQVPGLDLGRPEDARRLVRALVTLAGKAVAPHGHSPASVALAAVEAVGKLVKSGAFAGHGSPQETAGVNLPQPEFPV
jgi:hypothetical protein